MTLTHYGLMKLVASDPSVNAILDELTTGILSEIESDGYSNRVLNIDDWECRLANVVKNIVITAKTNNYDSRATAELLRQMNRDAGREA